MAGPFGKHCRPLLHAAKNVADATYAETILTTPSTLKNNDRTSGRHIRGEQQLKAALTVLTKQRMAYVTCEAHVHAVGKFLLEEEEEKEKAQDSPVVEEEDEPQVEGDEAMEVGDDEAMEEEEEVAEEPGVETNSLVSSPNWEDWRWDGDRVIVHKNLRGKISGIEKAAEKYNLKCETWSSVKSLRK